MKKPKLEMRHVRMGQDLIERIEKKQRELAKESKGLAVSFSDIVRVLIERGLEASK